MLQQKNNSQILATILITTKNQRSYLERSLPIIFSQTINNIEVILLDSSDRENNHDLFVKYPVKIIKIEPKTFNYSNAVNKGASVAKGKFLIRLSGDAVPKNKVWLESLINNFKDKKVGGVYSRWINDAKSNLFDRYIIFFAMRKHKLVFTKAPNWNAASGALRKEMWLKHPFNENLRFCDDWDWSRTIQKDGYAIVYEPRSVIYHSHNENVLQIGLRGLRTIKALVRIYLQT
jgi:rhamnosyltransferase